MANPDNSSSPYSPDGPPPQADSQRYATRPLGDPAPPAAPPYPVYAPPVAPPYPVYAPPVAQPYAYYAPPASIQRPRGILLILIYHAFAVVMSFGGLMFILPEVVDWWNVVVIVLILLTLGVLALLIAIGVGLWRMRPWAHILMVSGYGYICYMSIGELFAGLGAIGSASRVAPWEVLLQGLFLVGALATVIYLMLPENRALFRR